MCMRPCGPVRSGGYREPKEITKKRTFEILSAGSFESIEFYDNETKEFSQYDGPLSHVRAMLKNKYASLDIAKSWQNEYKAGYRTIIVSLGCKYLIRCK